MDWLPGMLRVSHIRCKKYFVQEDISQNNEETSKLLTTGESNIQILYASVVIFFLGLLLILGIAFVFIGMIQLIRK